MKRSKGEAKQIAENIRKCIRMAQNTDDTNLKLFWLHAEQGFIERALRAKKR